MTTSAEILTLATQYHATGNIALAEQYAASVLEEEPNNAEALQLLGSIAQEKGKPAEALAFLNRSLTANGANAAAWQQAGDILTAIGDAGGAITYYQQAQRLRPDFADGFNTLGVALRRVGRWAQALECFQQATRLAPAYAPALNNLGTALHNQGKLAEAAATLEKALSFWPDSPEIVYNLGNIRFDQGNWQEAVTCYRRALRLQPAYAAEVSNSLATALRKQGLREEAVAQYRETLRLRPGHAMALFNLSEMAGAGDYVFPPEDLLQAKDVLAAGRIGEAERILYAFAAANVLHVQAAYDEAFGFYQEANELQLRQFKKRNAAFDARVHEAQLERLKADHGPAYFETVKEWGTASELPIFIVGLPWSGTAQVEEVLASHPDVSSAGNSASIVRHVTQTAADKNRPLPDKHAAQTAAADYLQHLGRLGQGAARVLVNRLDNAVGLGLIATLFPAARVIHCRREPADAALACYFQNRRDLAFTCSLKDIAAYSLAHERLMTHWTRVLPMAIHEVKFEDLVNNREKTARALLAYCGLDWDERCATPPTVQSVADTVGLAELYRAHLDLLKKVLES